MLDETGSIRLEQRLSTTPSVKREVSRSMPGSRIALGDRYALSVGEPTTERVGIRSDRGACPQPRRREKNCPTKRRKNPL